MRNFLLGFALACAAAAGAYFIVSRQTAEHEHASPGETTQKYYCPMHPDYVSDRPGDCPICNMKLVPMEEKEAPKEAPEEKHESTGAPAGQEPKILYWTDPMHPGSRYDKPGKAPDGMDLVPVYEPEPQALAAAAAPGHAPVRIAPEHLQMMGVTLAEARLMNLEQSVRTAGIVTADETRTYQIRTKFEGYIEEIYADFTGRFVRRGQPLFSVYSPELEATQREYLLALRARDRLRQADFGERLPGIDLVEAARQRLALWDISPEQIAEIERRRAPIRALTFYSPVSGYVIAKRAVQGNRVAPADTLYDIVDLSKVWIMADLYEIDLPFVKVDDPATVSLPYMPGRVFRGRVDYIDPVLDGKSRTVKARIELPNPAGLFKPDMYAQVEIRGESGRGVAVPDSAVMGTGERQIVFVARGDGLFEPRTVTTGVKVRGYYEIKSGLAAGEQVVTGANFLLDSESKLKAALSAAAPEGE